MDVAGRMLLISAEGLQEAVWIECLQLSGLDNVAQQGKTVVPEGDGRGLFSREANRGEHADRHGETMGDGESRS